MNVELNENNATCAQAEHLLGLISAVWSAYLQVKKSTIDTLHSPSMASSNHALTERGELEQCTHQAWRARAMYSPSVASSSDVLTKRGELGRCTHQAWRAQAMYSPSVASSSDVLTKRGELERWTHQAWRARARRSAACRSSGWRWARRARCRTDWRARTPQRRQDPRSPSAASPSKTKAVSCVP